jgi:nanoRNase/pAp phosphatase (c-di-AMP/oligoRNAs hydrolase)
MFMLKYDHQLIEVKSRLPASNRILIVLPQNLTVDNLAAGLTLYLSLKSAGKKVDIVSTGTPLVSHTTLFGVGDLKNDLPRAGGGNFVIALDGVVDNTGSMQQVPALEKLDWYPEGSKLNLVFHVVPGQRFEPTNITSRHEESGYDLTWVIGCQSLNELGNLFISNSQYFAQGQVINVDINQTNGYFGFANVIDPQASSLSEVMAQILPSLTLNMDRDGASNIVNGIYAATNNLTQKINPDTFLVVSQAVQVGGTLPNASQPVSSQAQVSQPVESAQSQPQAVPAPNMNAQPQPESQIPVAPAPQPVPQPEPQYNTPVADSSVVQPQSSLAGSPFIVPPQDINIPMPVYQPEPQVNTQPVSSAPQFQFSQSFDAAQGNSQVQSVPPIPQANAQGFDLRQIFQNPQMAASAVPSNAQDTNNANPKPATAPIYEPVGGNPEMPHEAPQPQPEQKPDAAKVSAEERPMGEFAHSPNPEIESTPTPDWLVPKIFKGGNLG